MSNLVWAWPTIDIWSQLVRSLHSIFRTFLTCRAHLLWPVPLSHHQDIKMSTHTVFTESQDTLLASLDTATLQYPDVVCSVHPENCKISSSTWSFKSTNISPASVYSSLSNENNIEIPEVTRSREAFIFFGFLKALAMTLWQTWLWSKT